MRIVLFRLLIAITLISLLCSGCTKESVSNAKVRKNKAHNTLNQSSKEDGQVISMKKVKLPFESSTLVAYRMMYWSDGLKVEAYLAAPKGPGTYSLLVVCHGGMTLPMDSSHVRQIPSEGGTVTFDSRLLAGAFNNFITVAPTYRGYGNSNGKVKGIYENTIDTENAIKAANNYFNNKKETRHVQNIIYLEGVSMGGAVAMRVAAERDDVKSVIAISPFVGWNLFGTWEQKNQDNDKWSSYFNAGVETYGHFDPNYEIYKKQSIPYEKIKAPTLLIHGNADQTVPWQATQLLYKKMKVNHQNVTFMLINGGNHALTNKPNEMRDVRYKWYSQH